VPWTYYARVIDAIERLRTNNVPLVGVETAAGAVSYADFEWPRPVAVVFGNEVVGLPEEVLGGCNHVVRIPMRGYKNTINVATAFGIVLFEVIRRWESASIDTAGP
jgi:tRNA G18 (ribose-2'-O)-methylase SpoU